MPAKSHDEQDNFTRPTKNRSEYELEEKFKNETHGDNVCSTLAVTGGKNCATKARRLLVFALMALLAINVFIACMRFHPVGIVFGNFGRVRYLSVNKVHVNNALPFP